MSNTAATPDPPPAPAPASPGRVLQLHLWAPPVDAWHVRLAEPGAPERWFDSPFELARYLSNSPVAAPPADTARKHGGLR